MENARRYARVIKKIFFDLEETINRTRNLEIASNLTNNNKLDLENWKMIF